MSCLTITIEVNDEVDILDVSRKIEDFLAEKDEENRISAADELEKIEREFQSKYGKLTVLEVRNIEKSRVQLRQKIEDDGQLEKYQGQLNGILEAFEKIGAKQKVVRIGNSKNKKAVSQEDIDRLALIEEYFFQLLSFEPDVKVCRTDKIKNDPTCSCGAAFRDESSSSTRVCSRCGLIQQIMTNRGHSKPDVTLKEDVGQDLKNFRDEIQIDQGNLIPKDLPTGIFDKLNKYLKDHNLPVKEDILAGSDKYPLLKNLTRQRTSRSDMISALRECGFPKYYRYVRFFCHEIWDYPYPKYPHLEKQLEDDFVLSQPIFRKKVAGVRKSSNNVQFRLFVHLYRYVDLLDFELHESNYRVPTTVEIRESNQKTWNSVCADLEWGSPYQENRRVVKLGGMRKKPAPKE